MGTIVVCRRSVSSETDLAPRRALGIRRRVLPSLPVLPVGAFLRSHGLCCKNTNWAFTPVPGPSALILLGFLRCFPRGCERASIVVTVRTAGTYA